MTIQQRLQKAFQDHQAGRLADAERGFHKVLAQEPAHADAMHMLGIVAAQRGKRDEAVKWIRRAVKASPNNAFYYGSLGNALQDLRQLDEAIASFREAIRLKPDLAEAHNNLANVLRDTGQLDDAIASFRETIRLRPDKITSHSNLLAALSYHPGYSAAAIYEEHRLWNTRHAEPLKKLIQPHTNDRDPRRPLNLGYVSADLVRHPVGQFMASLLAHHDSRDFKIYCYSNSKFADEITARLRESSSAWRDVAGMSDAQLAAQIRQDRIDIIVDLSLHSVGNRLLVFAQKPAPVQVTWLGYPGTTGLTTMDYRLTDPYLDQPEGDAFYSEQSIRLPSTFWCYEPVHATPVNALPAGETGHVTFGCFNNFAKTNVDAMELWAQILSAIPRSRLLMLCPTGGSRARVVDRFGGKGIEPARIEFTERVPLADYFLQFHRIDIALDPFPWGGGTTTCDALWMGVPTITLRGTTAVGRAGVSILSNVGLLDWIAQTPEQYLAIATKMSADVSTLAQLRSGLRTKMQQSPLMDAARFAADMQAAYRRMWEQWCLKSDSLHPDQP
jgi:predicted O-linked N-acetylglucosamine transferase (SPINDLY family)